MSYGSCISLILIIILLYSFNKNNFIQCCFERCEPGNCLLGHSDIDDQRCTSCSTNYYFLPDIQNNNCYNNSELKEKGYYYISGTNSFENCYNKCATCVDDSSPSDSNMECLTCKPGYFKKDSSSTRNCYFPYEIENNYYKETSTSLSDPDIFKECYVRCNTCSELGNSANHKCDSCKSGTNIYDRYYKLDSGETGNCYLYNEIDDTYEIPLVDEYNEIATQKINERNGITDKNDENYVSIYELIARKCYRNCETCTQFGDDINMHCVTCKNGYYFYKNNCYKKCPKPQTYYLKGSNQCKELVEGYKIVTDYKTPTDIVQFLLFHGLGEFDFEQNLITGNKIYGQIYSFKNKRTNDEFAERLILSKIIISDECINKIINYYGLENDIIEELVLIKFDKNYTNIKRQ